MQLEAISPDIVHKTLNAIRTSRSLASSPLLGLDAVSRQLDAEHLVDNPANRAALLPRWLDGVIRGELGRLRGEARSGSADAPTVARKLELLAGDYQAHSVEREVWGALHFRFFSGSTYTVAQLADVLGVNAKTLHRRINRGYQALAQVLQDLERTATAGVRHGRLVPEELTRFIGREAELAEIRQLLAYHRLVTLTGIGGIGKSRLAVRLARDLAPDFGDGAWFVEMAQLAENQDLLGAVVRTFGLRERPGWSLADVLLHYLSDRRLLLVLDNCEHLVAACSQLTKMVIARAPSVQVLATSREALHVDGQAIFQVPPMALPSHHEPVDAVLHSDAVRLFGDRVTGSGIRIGGANAEQVARLCTRLDGIPLAIELAAARTRHLSLAQIEERLEDRFGLLRDGRRASRPGHETLSAALEMSYRPLPEPQKRLLQRLSVFQGDWTLAEAEEVCSGEGIDTDDVLDILSELEARSLVEVRRAAGLPRYRFLETVREFARARLEDSNTASAWRHRHTMHFLALAESAEPELRGPRLFEWLSRLDSAGENLLLALRYARDAGRTDEGLRMGRALSRYWWFRGREEEGRQALGELLEQPSRPEWDLLRADALRWAGFLAERRGDHQACAALYHESMTIERRLGDPLRIARLQVGIAHHHYRVGEHERARGVLTAALETLRSGDDLNRVALAELYLGTVLGRQGRHEEGRTLLERSLATVRAGGNIGLEPHVLMSLGLNAYATDDLESARRHFVDAIALFRRFDNDNGVLVGLLNLGDTLMISRQPDQAKTIFEECIAGSLRIGSRGLAALAQSGLARVHLERGDATTAGELLSASTREFSRRPEDRRKLAEVLATWARHAVFIGRPERAVRIIAAAMSLRGSIEHNLIPSEVADVEYVRSAAKTHLGANAFAAAEAGGHALTLDEAVTYALGQVAWKDLKPAVAERMAADGDLQDADDPPPDHPERAGST